MHLKMIFFNFLDCTIKLTSPKNNSKNSNCTKNINRDIEHHQSHNTVKL